MFSTMIASISQMFAKLFDWRKTETEHQIEKVVINDIKDAERALEDALTALNIANKYTDEMTIKDRFIFKSNYKSFLKEK